MPDLKEILYPDWALALKCFFLIFRYHLNRFEGTQFIRNISIFKGKGRDGMRKKNTKINKRKRFLLKDKLI